jgi:glutaredoxin
MIFIGEHFVGGYTELARIHRQGQLESLLEGTA